MIQTIFIPGKQVGLNEYSTAERTHRMIAAKIKKQGTNLVAETCYATKIKPVEKPIWLYFQYNEGDSRRDPDNIVFFKKMILDGLVKAGVIPNDNQKWIMGFTDQWAVVTNKKDIGIEVTIEEME